MIDLELQSTTYCTVTLGLVRCRENHVHTISTGIFLSNLQGGAFEILDLF